MAITLNSTIREILRERPRAVEVLEAAVGADFWNGLGFPLSDLGSDKHVDATVLLLRIQELPSTLGELDWSKAPLYELVDRLAADHRRFRETDLPLIERLLEDLDAGEATPGNPLEALRVEFHAFKIDFLLHMNEEEEFLFPKALRTEASIQHPQITPETFRGSVTAYSPVMLHTPEVQIKQLVVEMVARLKGPVTLATPALERLRAHLEDLEGRIIRHADLEIEYLLPRTLAQERALHRRAMESAAK